MENVLALQDQEEELRGAKFDQEEFEEEFKMMQSDREPSISD